jgi:hypothetical protein
MKKFNENEKSQIMKKHVYVIVVFLTLTIPFSVQADTLILKSGREIEASKCWHEGEIIKCEKFGQVIGFSQSEVETVILDKQAAVPADGFLFDIWRSGISVAEAVDLAQDHDIPLHKAGIISINKHFNPKVCRPYANTATEFEYNAQLLGRQARIAMKFTPTSKKLYSIRLVWSGPGISKKSEFRDQIEAMLTKKYGKPAKIKEHYIFRTYDFKINKFSFVTMRPGGNYVMLEYLDNRLVKLAEDETEAKVRKDFTGNDNGKF